MTVHEQQSRQQLRELIKDIRFAMLVTRGKGGVLHARPMTTQSSPADDEQGTGQLWFFMSRSSDRSKRRRNVSSCSARPSSRARPTRTRAAASRPRPRTWATSTSSDG